MKKMLAATAVIATAVMIIGASGTASAGDGAEASKVKKFKTVFTRVGATSTSMSGRVRPKGNMQGPAGACFVSRTVKVNKIAGGKRTKIASKMSNPNTGDFNMNFHGMGGPGKYQAVAPKFTVGKVVCKRGVSKVRKVKG